MSVGTSTIHTASPAAETTLQAVFVEIFPTNGIFEVCVERRQQCCRAKVPSAFWDWTFEYRGSSRQREFGRYVFGRPIEKVAVKIKPLLKLTNVVSTPYSLKGFYVATFDYTCRASDRLLITSMREWGVSAYKLASQINGTLDNLADPAILTAYSVVSASIEVDGSENMPSP
jgi:hypothetical protein